MTKHLVVLMLSFFVLASAWAEESIDLDLEVLALLAENDVNELGDADEPDFELEEEAEIDLGEDLSEEEMLPPDEEEEEDLVDDKAAPKPPGYEESMPQQEKSKQAEVVAEKQMPVTKKKKAMIKKKRPSKKLTTSGFKRLKSNCYMRSVASVKGDPIKTLKRGKKLWTETHNSEWTKIFRKKGVAFISNKCL